MDRSFVSIYFKPVKKSDKTYFDTLIRLDEQDTVFRDKVNILSCECSLHIDSLLRGPLGTELKTLPQEKFLISWPKVIK